jgi:hypothetical protein
MMSFATNDDYIKGILYEGNQIMRKNFTRKGGEEEFAIARQRRAGSIYSGFMILLAALLSVRSSLSMQSLLAFLT